MESILVSFDPGVTNLAYVIAKIGLKKVDVLCSRLSNVSSKASSPDPHLLLKMITEAENDLAKYLVKLEKRSFVGY